MLRRKTTDSISVSSGDSIRVGFHVLSREPQHRQVLATWVLTATGISTPCTALTTLTTTAKYRNVTFSAAKEDVPVSPTRVCSFAPAHSRPLTRARTFSPSFAKTMCRATYFSYAFSFVIILCRVLLSSIDISLLFLLHHGRGPGLVDFLCHNHVLGLTVLLHHVHGPFLVHYLQHENMLLSLLLLLCHDRGLGLILLLCHTGTHKQPI